MNTDQILKRFIKATKDFPYDEDGENSDADSALFNEFHEFEAVPSKQSSLSFGSVGYGSTFSDYLNRCLGLSGPKLEQVLQECIEDYLKDLAND